MVEYDLIIALVMMHHFAAKVTTDETFELGFTKQEKKREKKSAMSIV